MAEPIKSALLLDYESLQRAMSGGERSGDTRLADRAAAWLAAIESGRLIGPEGTRRKLILKRCYAGPSVRGKQRDALTSAGFEIVDCGAGDGARSSVDLHMAMDTVDALSKPNAPDEFIILSGSELTPLMTRLRGAKRAIAIYAGDKTADSEKMLADAVLDGGAFVAFLASNEDPTAKSGGGSASDRAEIEAFARKIHAATNIPLFSPKTFAELFRHLVEEIRDHGYHFQMTAKNVADRMTAGGRTVTRRQVVFIVKGLALKGHVFSTTDTPEGLAEVFRDQAQYLITNAGIALDDKQDRLLSAWFMSRPAVPGERAAAAEKPPSKATPPTVEARPVSVRETPPERAPKPEPESEPEFETAVEIEAEPEPVAPKRSASPPQEKTRPVAFRPNGPTRPAPVKPVDLPKSAAKPQPARQPKTDAREEARAVIAARIAASAKLRPGARGPVPKTPPPQQQQRPGPPKQQQPQIQAKPRPPAAPTRGPQPPQNASRQPDALEDSILAAIAEAVDVLVEDGSDADEQRQDNSQRRPATNSTARPPERKPEPEPTDDDAESGDIGDQIQRIIASYNRNRGEE